jgi:hypothetical protein
MLWIGGVCVVATHVCERISNKMKVWFTWIVVVQEAMSDYNIIEEFNTFFQPLTRGFPQRIYHALVISVCDIF